MNMQKKKSSRADILFQLFFTQEKFCKIHYFSLFKTKDNLLKVQEDIKHLTCQQDADLKSNDLIVIDNHAGLSGLNQINQLISRWRMSNISGMAVFCNNRELKSLVKMLKQITQLQTSVFGVHPDYYYCFIPIDSTRRQHIETYIFELKTDPSWKGKIKKIIKHLMILWGVSNRLYEYFLIIAVPEFKK
jgi:hypothetical protein